MENALASYKSAIKTNNSVFTAAYLLKAGLAAELLGRKDEALGFYNDIKVKYPTTVEAMEVDKYISRLENAEN